MCGVTYFVVMKIRSKECGEVLGAQKVGELTHSAVTGTADLIIRSRSNCEVIYRGERELRRVMLGIIAGEGVVILT